jgi:hypothetical protein
MSRISRSVRRAIKEGSLFPAIIVEYGGGRASARLSTNGAIYTNLEVVGGTPKRNDPCWIDFSTSTPYIIVEHAQEQASAVVVPPKPSRANVGSKTTTGTSGSSGSVGGAAYGVILYAAGVVKAAYDANQSGLSSAISESTNGDAIFLPNGTIGGDHTIPTGVSLFGLTRYGAVLSGQITLSGGNYIENLSMSGSGASNRVVVTGDVTIRSCDIDQFNGSYDALRITGGYSLFRECHIEAPGTCVSGTSGSGHFFGCDFACTTDIDATNLTIFVYGNQLHATIGTINYVKGDRAAYSGTNHSSDIDSGAYQYHIPFPTSGSGQTVLSSGSGWYAGYLPSPDLGNHSSTHGHNGADEFVHISSGSPSRVFAGKLWLQT